MNLVQFGAGSRLAATYPQLAEVLDRRAVALERGLDAHARPADVAALAARYRPTSDLGLAPDERQQLGYLIGEAIGRGGLRVQTTVTAQEAVHLLTNGGRMRTIYDAVGAGVDDLFIGGDVLLPAQDRAARELKLDIAGTGTNVYGVVRIGDVTADAEPDPLAAIQRNVVNPRLSTGSYQYGDVSFVLHPQLLDRASFAPSDTGLVGSPYGLGAVEQLPDILAERIGTHFMLGARGFGSTSNAFNRYFEPGTLEDNVRRLLYSDAETGVAAIQRHLASSAMDADYAEAQVRHVDLDAGDVAAVNVRRPVLPNGATYADQQAVAGVRALQDQLADLGAARGIPVRYDDAFDAGGGGGSSQGSAANVGSTGNGSTSNWTPEPWH